jgi:hypothetical protein
MKITSKLDLSNSKYQMPNRKRTAPTTISPFNKSTTNLNKN